MDVINQQGRFKLNATELGSLEDVIAACVALGAPKVGGPLSRAERRLLDGARATDLDIEALRSEIRTRHDPLGEALCRLRSANERRKSGAFFTPWPVVAAMTSWVLDQSPSRLIDAGCGSGRFAGEALIGEPTLKVIAVDSDPLATLTCRALLAVLGASDATVINGDYTRLVLEEHKGKTAYVGNPPYVRHHDLTARQKDWLKKAARDLGLSDSGLGLAGLHVHFFLATARHASDGDVGCFITSAEWLDVGYGQVLRSALLNGLGGLSIHLIDPTFVTFKDAMSTAVITCFEKGTRPSTVRTRTISERAGISSLGSSGRKVPTARFSESSRWTGVIKGVKKSTSRGKVPLGELVRVSRGCVTGANRYFVLTQKECVNLGLQAWMVPVVSSAQEVFDSGGTLRFDDSTKLLLDPPRNIDLNSSEQSALNHYLKVGKGLGVPDGYICSHRNPWWHVGSKSPVIVATYMARQPPAFALNPEGIAILNVLHGFFPREEFDEEQLLGLVRYLNVSRESFRGSGRMYQGGLEKFEPSEMEAIEVPPAKDLRAYARG